MPKCAGEKSDFQVRKAKRRRKRRTKGNRGGGIERKQILVKIKLNGHTILIS